VKGTIKILAAIVAIIAVPLALSQYPYWLDMLTLVGFWGVLAGSWNILAGYAGQISLGQAAFSGIGAYSVAILFAFGGRPVWQGLVVGVAAASVASVVLGFSTLRLRGPYFAIATIAFAQMAAVIARSWRSFTQGSEGIFLPFEPRLANLMFESGVAYAILFLLMALLVAILSAAIAPSRTGVFLRAIRDDDIAASSLGVRVRRLKLGVLIASAGIAAVAGAANAARIGFVDPSVMSLQLSIKVALIAVIGGMGRPAGALIGAIAVVPAEAILRAQLGGSVGALHLATYGLVVILLLRVAPGGLIDLAERMRRRFRSASADRVRSEMAQ
jgi:branched-chain amino acid transport system permease protein